MVNRVDRSDEIHFRTVSLPNIGSDPLIRRREIPVDFFQFHIERIAELPEGVVYINYRYLAQSCFILRVMWNIISQNSVSVGPWNILGHNKDDLHPFPNQIKHFC